MNATLNVRRTNVLSVLLVAIALALGIGLGSAGELLLTQQPRTPAISGPAPVEPTAVATECKRFGGATC